MFCPFKICAYHTAHNPTGSAESTECSAASCQIAGQPAFAQISRAVHNEVATIGINRVDSSVTLEFFFPELGRCDTTTFRFSDEAAAKSYEASAAKHGAKFAIMIKEVN